jgi:hypothetical protein
MGREKVIEGLEKVWDAFNHMEHELYADYVFDALALLKEQEAEIAFLKAMQLQTVHNMSDEDIGNAVRNVLRL